MHGLPWVYSYIFLQYFFLDPLIRLSLKLLELALQQPTMAGHTVISM